MYRNKVLFIVSSAPQIDIFKQIIKDLENFNIKFVNTAWFNGRVISDLLKKNDYDFDILKTFETKKIDEILKKEAPKVVITAHDKLPMDILFIKSANSLGIKSLTVQDGILVRQSKEYSKNTLKNILHYLKIPYIFIICLLKKPDILIYYISIYIFKKKYIQEYPLIYGHGDSNFIAVFGNSVKDMLIKEGISSKKIIITGSPKFDQLLKYENDNIRKKIRKKFNISNNKKIILVLTQYFVESGEWTSLQRKIFISEIAKSLSSLNNFILILKLHPSYEKEKYYSEILKNLNIPFKIYKNESTTELVSICDLAISVSSTAALEAMLLKKPTLIINLFKDNGSKFYKDSGTSYVEKKEDIAPLIKIMLSGNRGNADKIEKFVYNHAYLVDGRSSQRIANIIRHLAKCDFHVQ